MDKIEYKGFLKELISYYKKSMKDISESIEDLAKIEEIYPKEYVQFRELNESPENFLKLDLDNDSKALFFELMLKSATLTKRIGSLLALTSTEKKLLAKELNAYATHLEGELKEVNKND